MHETKNSVPAAKREKVAEILNQNLANLSDLYSQTKHAHWNVRGKLFISLHKLFDELAEVVEEQIDPLAERITALGGIAKGTIRMAAQKTSLPEFAEVTQSDDLSYVQALIERFAVTANALRKAIDDIGDEDAVSQDLVTGMAGELDKALWFLEAHNRK